MPVVVSEKGSVVIPADLRRKYKLGPGTELFVVDYGGVLALVPAMEKPARQAAGMLKGRTSLSRAGLSSPSPASRSSRGCSSPSHPLRR